MPICPQDTYVIGEPPVSPGENDVCYLRGKLYSFGNNECAHEKLAFVILRPYITNTI